MDYSILEALASTCRTAAAHDKVLNSECCYTFYSPYTTGEKGILVNLKTFMGTCLDLSLTANEDGAEQAVFVRIVKERVAKEGAMMDTTDTTTTDATDATDADTTTEAAKAPTRLGVGVEGGFLSDEDKYDTIQTNSVVVLRKSNTDDSSNKPVIVVELPYTDATKNSFPLQVAASVDSILCHVGLAVQQDVKVWQLDADEDIPVSRFAADLQFVDNHVVIDPNPAAWKCQKTGDTTNLWLNLSDGFIGGGRKNWDGSGGSNGALDHFEEMGKQDVHYPLVVKLGTITADLSTADCYSYDPSEDGPVKIPNLAILLEKRGILVAGMQKTVKSTAEMEVELNANYAFDAITEAGSQLEPCTGPGLQGLQNLGNSCYMNSVVQLFLSGTVPELASRYGTTAATGFTGQTVTQNPLLTRVSPTLAPDDLLVQVTKVGCALTSGVFCKPPSVLALETTEQSAPSANDPKYRLAPRMLKHVVGKDHVDFCTGQQQDAAQFAQYFLEKLDRAEQGAAAELVALSLSNNKGGNNNDNGSTSAPLHTASHLFSFQTTSRMVCSADQRIKYKDSAAETVWSLRIPMDKAVVKEQAGAADAPDQKRFKPEEGKEEEEKKPIPTIDFMACVDEWANDTQVDDIRWSHLQNAVHAASERTRFTNFPRYLMLQMQRYELGPDWAPIKLEVNVDMPEELDLSAFKSTGPQQDENLIPDDVEETTQVAGGGATASAAPAIDEAAVGQLMDMGFSLNACKRALAATGGSNVEAAIGWAFEHNSDPDFNDPLPEAGEGATAASASDAGVDEGVVQSLVENLGCFTAEQVRAALKETSGAADRAADWLFSHMDDLDGAIAALESKNQPASSDSSSPKVPVEDGEGKYKLVGLVSHIGKNTGSGHYVAHLKKDDKWVIFNDEKVALSSQPPIQHAYMYLFQRIDSIGTPNPNY